MDYRGSFVVQFLNSNMRNLLKNMDMSAVPTLKLAFEYLHWLYELFWLTLQYYFGKIIIENTS